MSDEIKREWLEEELDQVMYAAEDLMEFMAAPLDGRVPELQAVLREKIDNSVDFLKRYGVENLDGDLEAKCRAAFHYVEVMYEEWAAQMDHLKPLMKTEDFETFNNWVCETYDAAGALEEVGTM